MKGPVQYLCLPDGEIMSMFKIKDTLFFVPSVILLVMVSYFIFYSTVWTYSSRFYVI